MDREPFSEQFIPDHVFFYVSTGTLLCYDGTKTYAIRAGEYCLARKGHLARYTTDKAKEFDLIYVCFEEDFIQNFQNKHRLTTAAFRSNDTFIKLNTTELIPEFIRSIKPYYQQGKIDDAFADVKQEELLIILLQNQPELAGVFFDYAVPGKLNLAEFMNRNYQFNVSLSRFAYLTGRSLSAFKRDFNAIFNDTPNRWLVSRRLDEAYFLLSQQAKKPSDIYLDLGFEALSHFSYAFKQRFGLTPTELSGAKKEPIGNRNGTPHHAE